MIHYVKVEAFYNGQHYGSVYSYYIGRRDDSKLIARAKGAAEARGYNSLLLEFIITPFYFQEGSEIPIDSFMDKGL